MISVSNLSKSFGGQTLFQGVSLQFNPENRYGLVGANGSGKSTFLRMLTGEEISSEGSVSMPRRARLGVLKQDHFRYETTAILDVVMMGNQTLWHAMTQKEILLASAEQHFDADKYSELEEVILSHDGYALEAQLALVADRLRRDDRRDRKRHGDGETRCAQGPAHGATVLLRSCARATVRPGGLLSRAPRARRPGTPGADGRRRPAPGGS